MIQPFAGQIGDELKSFYELAERFAKKELEPKALELDRYPYSEFNWQALMAANETGLLKLVLAESLGGSGQGMAALSIILSRLAQADASFAAVIFINALAQAAVEKWADKQVAQKALKSETSAASSLLAFPVYAPPADLPLEVKAAKGKDGYVLDGECSMLALAPVADRMIIPAEINNSGKASFFLLDKSEPGIKMSDPVLTLGLHNCPVADVTLQGVEAGPENLLGGEGRPEKNFPDFVTGFGGPLAALAHGVLAGSYQARPNRLPGTATRAEKW